ncbi:hypothetical protein BGZ96_008808, partial [Linnemannia gamsii]
MDARARDMDPTRNSHNNDHTLPLEKRAVAIPEPVEPTTKPKPKPPPATTAKPKPPTSTPPVKPPPVITTKLPPVIDPTPTITTSSIEPTSTVVPGNSNGTDPSSTTSGGLGTGAIVGIVAGVAVVLALIAGLLFWNKRNKRRGEEVHKAELYQQQRMMSDNSSVLASGRVPHHQRFNSSSGLGTAAVVTAGAGSRNGGVASVGKRGMGGEGDRESLSEDYRQQQEQYYQQQPEWFAKKSPLEYYSQVPPVEQLMRGVGRKESDNSLNSGMGSMGGVGDKDEIELQLAGPSMSSSAPGQGHSEIMAARSLQESTMQHNLQQQHLQQQQLQQNPFQAQHQQQQQYGRESTSLNSTDAGRYNEPAMVIPRQQPTRQQQQQQQQQLREHSRAESNPPHSGHLPPIQMHSPMGSVYHDPAQTPTNSSYHPVPPMPSRPNSFYNVGNILNAAGETTTTNDYAEVDMTSYYRPPPPAAAPSTPSGFYDFDVPSDSNNTNPRMLPTNGSSFAEGTGIGAG